MERELPYDVDVEVLLHEVLEYMEDRTDIEDGEHGPKPNKEMRFASEIRQVLFQMQNAAVKPKFEGARFEFDPNPPVTMGEPYNH